MNFLDDDSVNSSSIENIIYSDYNLNTDFYVIVDTYLNKDSCLKIKNLIQSTLNDYSKKIKVIYPFNRILTKSELKNNIGVNVRKHKINLSKIIPEKSKIITIGKALYVLTNGNTDIQLSAFYDFIFNLTYFFSPETKSYIFPIDSYSEVFNKDDFPLFFASKQIDFCNKKNKPILEERPQLVLVEDVNKFLTDYSSYDGKLGLDTETSGFNFLSDRLGCVTLCFYDNDQIGYYLRWDDINIDLFNKFLKNKKLIGHNFKFDIKMLYSHGVKLENINYYADTLALSHICNEMRSNKLKTLDWLYTQFGGYEDFLDDYKRRYKNLKNYLEIPEEVLFPYATMDAIITIKIYKRMTKQLEFISNKTKEFIKHNQYSTKNYYLNLVMPATRKSVKDEIKGLAINKDKVKEANLKIKDEIQKIDNSINELLGFTVDTSFLDNELSQDEFNLFLEDIDTVDEDSINLNSNEQLGRKLEEIGLPDLGRNKKNVYNVNVKTLKSWRNMGYEIASLIIKKHEWEVLNKTFIGEEHKNNGIWKEIYKDGKIHSLLHVCLADSSRSRMSNINLQQTPSRGWKAQLVRQIFLPDSTDFEFISSDFSGLQMYIAAIMSNGKNMREVITKYNGEFHTITAHSIFYKKKGLTVEDCFNLKKEGDEQFKISRYNAKQLNFLLLFGGKASLLMKNAIQDPDKGWNQQDLNKYIDENGLKDKLVKARTSYKYKYQLSNLKEYLVAEDLREKFLNDTYPELKDFQQRQIEFAEKNGFVISPHGVIRRLPQLMYVTNSSDKRVVSNLRNISVNSPVQAFESYVVQRWLIEINDFIENNHLRSRIFAMVHDAGEFMSHKLETNKLLHVIKELAAKDYPEYEGIRFKVECNKADYYGKGQLWDLGEPC